MSDNRRAFRNYSGKAAGMIEMMVRENGIPDGLVRNNSLRFCNDLLGSRLALRSTFKENNVVLELNRERVISGVDAEDAICQFFGFRCCSSSYRRRCCSRISTPAGSWRRQQLLNIRGIRIGPEDLR